jgi:superfamily I DNA and/or RNA helicase/predicted RNA-binding protein with RPS1 domain
MLFNKYQYNSNNIQKRGYTQNTRAFSDEFDNKGNRKGYWVKWILGIEKNDTKAKILADKLRSLQKARHFALPDIIDYGFDEGQQAFAIVYKLLEDVETLENKVFKTFDLKTQGAISGLIDLTDCLKELHLKHKINHGDIHPANILIDTYGQFYLVDFGLADITRTLSQTRELEIFARGFAAPEKLNKLSSIGFPFQSDIYSLGKIIEWFFDERQENISEEQNIQLQRFLAENPGDRPNWQQVIDFLKNLAISDEEYIEVAFRQGYSDEAINDLNKNKIYFDVLPSEGNNYLVDILSEDWFYPKALWLKDERRLLLKDIYSITSQDYNFIARKKRESKKLPFQFKYILADQYNITPTDLTPYFQKWFELKKKQVSLRENRKAVREELGFYRELLEKEKEVIAKNSLRLQYTGFELKGDEIIFKIKPNEKCSSIGYVQKHIEEGNDANSEGFEYVVSANSDRKQNKETVEFAGKPYDLNTDEYLLKIKDCERLKKESIPQAGFIFENISKKEEEKKRQLDAINKVEKNEVQNPDLIYYLFKPQDLPPSFSDYSTLEKVWQVDKFKKPLIYSDNQTKAIRNALNKTPLSIIQGPPGTGKTTVITEIVFQILSQKPEAKILITSQTNNAVDQVLENLLQNEIPILRLSGITKPKIQSIQKHTLDRKLEGWKQQVKEIAEKNFKKEETKFLESLSSNNAFAFSIVEIILHQTDWKKAKEKIETLVSRVNNLNHLQSLPEDQNSAITRIENSFNINLSSFLTLRELHRDWIVTINSLDEKSSINQKLIDSIRVIGATCNHIAAKKYAKYNFEFDYVIMDESGKATTAEALVPIITGKNLIFVGDHRQLRPMLTKTKEVESWLRERFKKEAEELDDWDDYFNRASLFEQVITNIDYDYKAQLTVCRRSSAEQVKLTSKCFYEPEGDEPIEPVTKDISDEHNLPLGIESSIIFIDTGSHYKNKADNKSKSSLNEESAKIIPEILELLNKYEKVKEYSFGVITGYTAQSHLLKKNIDKKKFEKKINSINKWNKTEEKLSVSVVDRFQGLERDVVIVDLVVSGAGLKLGFLEVPNRINVALSRQKKLLIIVGDYYGIINAKTKRLKGKKAALQHYLEALKKDWVVKAEQIKAVFPSKEVTLPNNENKYQNTAAVENEDINWKQINELYEKGSVIQGRILNRTKSGFEVNLLGYTAFLPGSQIAPPKKLLKFDEIKIGQEYDMKIIKINTESKNIVVSFRPIFEEELKREKNIFIHTLEKNQIRKGVIKNITKYGAFVTLSEGVDGLVHINDMGENKITELALGQELDVIILDFNEKKERITLSINKVF